VAAAPASSAPASSASPARGEPTSSLAGAPDVDAAARGLRLDKPIDLGPAGALVATERGVIFRTRADELAGVPLDASGVRKRARSEDKAEPSEGARATRGAPPAFTSSSHGYWITRGKLVRKAFDWDAGGGAEALEVLADDAVDGSRVAASTATGPGRDVAVYIARASHGRDDRTAKLWVEGAAVAPLSSEGSGASSAAIANIGSRLVAVTLDERSAMSPVHARTIELDASGPPRLGADTVVFVGPSPESHNEIATAVGREGPFAFIPFARDTSSFGLASLLIGAEPHLDAPVEWTMYPNGIEPAPVDAARFCGRTWVAYVRPSAATPDAPSMLVLAPLDNRNWGAEITAGQGFDFLRVSLAPRSDGGGWLAWVGNGRSWVRGIKCS